mmetsp:Transcript_12993/g.25949  ORF Transcript_12993/g.25949 Transcript_12993/m.25949 type:complete len:209 (+) Transcript_12993:8-634(+)
MVISSRRLLCFLLTGFILCTDVAHSFSGFCIPGSSAGSRPLAISIRQAMRLRTSPVTSLSMQDGEGSKGNIPGKWVLEATVEGEDITSYMDLNPDQTLTMSVFSSVSNPKGSGGARDDRMRWKMKGKDFAIEVPKRSTLSTSFLDRTYLGVVKPGEELMIEGTVIDGEDEPEYVGKFVLKQLKSFGGGAAAWGEEDEWDGEVDEEAHL